MLESITPYVPLEIVKFLLVLALSLLLGFERESKKAKGDHYYFGGIATFPLIALTAFGLGVLSSESLIPLGIGLAVIGGFLLISYRHKLQTSELSGFVTELTGITAYLLGALVFFEHYWIATTLVVFNLILLELKRRLEVLTKKAPSDEIFVLARFLFLTAVILPIVPNQEFTAFKLNPYKIWLVVVAVSSLSYLSYLLQRYLKERGGILILALLGGAYSSTAVTVSLSKRSRETNRPHLYSGSILLSSGVMLLRTLVLLALFNSTLFRMVYPPFLILAGLTLIGGYLWSRLPDPAKNKTDTQDSLKNPLEMLTALLLALIFLLILIANQLVVQFFGVTGIYYLAGLVGAVDVDPFTLGLTQNAGNVIPYPVAATAVFLAVSGNNFMKAIYALIFGAGKTGRQTAFGLFLLTLGGLAGILWLKVIP